MKSARVVLIVALSLMAARGAVSAGEVINDKPCLNNASLTFDDTPSFRVGDPKRAEKQALGTNPLQTKEIQINATETMISVLVRTHDSFPKYWDYAQKRDASGISVGTPAAGEPLRGELTRFIAMPKGKPGKAIDVRVWLEYAYETGYTAKVHVANQTELATKAPHLQGQPRPTVPADIATPIDVSLGLNEAEIRIPTATYGFDADDEIVFRFRRGETSVCVPEKD